MEVTLVAVKADGAQRDAAMKRARLIIGRKKECDIRVPVPSVSREHCELRVEGGRLIAKDLGSSNGTYINGERIQEMEVTAGQILGIGPAVFVIRIDGKPVEIDAKQAAVKGAAPTPVAAARAPSVRPAAPAAGGTPGATGPKAAAKGKPKDDDDDLDELEGSSVGDFDFDFLDEEEDQPKL